MKPDVSPKHVPVMVDEIIEHLITDKSGFYIDATFGDGGHTNAILNNTDEDAMVLGIDRDSTAIARGRLSFKEERRLILRHGKFSQIMAISKEFKNKISGIVIDLGISSTQLHEAARGFSFTEDGPLDMRMDQSEADPLFFWLAKVSQNDLAAVIRDFGEEPDAAAIAAAIVRERQKLPIETTSQLKAIVLDSKARTNRRPKAKISPATKTFQSLRIFINNEMEELSQVLRSCMQILMIGGRLAVISFHSLESRKVKAMINMVNKGEIMRLVYKSKPSRTEVLQNNRSRSALLRVMEKQEHLSLGT